MSSLTNFVVTAVAARQASPGDLGTFSVALAIYIFVLWLSRSLVAEPYVVRFTGKSVDEQRRAARDAVGSALMVGAVAGSLTLMAALVVGSTTGTVLAAMGLAMPSLLAQDTYRYILIVAGRPKAAAANDAVWFIGQFAGLIALFAVGGDSILSITIVFGTAATGAGLVAARQTGVIPARKSAVRWIRAHGDLGLPYVLELIAVSGMTQLTMVAIAVVGSIVAVGALRAATLLLSPLTVVFSGVFLIAGPEAVRLRHRSLPAMSRFVNVLALSMSITTILWGVALAFVPQSLGIAVLQSNWDPARNLLVPVTALTAATACALSAVVGLRALAVARESLRVRVWCGPATLILGVTGTLSGGAFGAAIGLGVAASFGAIITWATFRRVLSRTIGLLDQSDTGVVLRGQP